jgi:hypothetical protein
MVCLVGLLSLASFAYGADTSSGSDQSTSVTSMMRQMVGTWDVEAKMWPAPGAQAIELPAAIARRELVGAAFLQETMEPAKPSQQNAFTRMAYFSYNPVNRQYEYFSLDSRLPQIMSYAVPGANRIRGENVELAGTSFVAPEWGAKKNVPFMYRLAVGPVRGNRQVVQLFLTEQRADAAEFLAFEYVYTR